jgi:hypothetical protein
MNLKRILISSLTMATLVISCKEKNVYEGCCDNTSLTGKVGNISFSIANVFTPNADGINDVIVISTKGDIGKVTDFILNDKNSNEVWRSKDVKTLATDYTFPMNASVLNNIPEGKLDYSFIATPTTGNAVIFKGSICKNTSKGADCAGNNVKCQFPNQNDNGTFSPQIPSGELCK